MPPKSGEDNEVIVCLCGMWAKIKKLDWIIV